MFNRYEAERYLLLAGDLPGYRRPAGACARPGAARGEVIGEVTVVAPAGAGRRHRPESRLARARPLGRAAARPALRPDRARRPHHASPLFTTADTDEQQTLQIGHDFRIGSEGLAIGGQLTYAWAQPGPRHLPGVDIEFAHPVRDAGGELSRSSAGRRGRCAARSASTSSTRISTSTTIPLNRDRLRVAFARLDLRRARAGRPAIRATRRPSRAGGSAPAPSCARGSTSSAPATAAAPGLVNCLAPGVGAADPARGRSDRDRAARRRSTASSGRCRGSPSRSALRGQ